MKFLFAPGFTSSGPVHVALALGAMVAIVSALVGVFTVVRSQSFAGHALTDVATAGGAGAGYLGVNALAGFVVGSLTGGVAMETIGVHRVRSRDVATDIVLGAATGCSALFFYLAANAGSSTGSTQRILFGSLFEVAPDTLPIVGLLSVVTVAALALIGRALLLSSVSPEMATVGGISTRSVGVIFMLTLAVSVGLSSVAIGAILSTALLIGPAASALRMARTIRGAMLLACVLGVVATSLGVLLAYDSYNWSSRHTPLPVSFFVVVVVVVTYALTYVPVLRRRATTGRS